MSLKRISEMTGVSVSTVGRILRDPAHKCTSEDIRRRVLRAARDINYIPNEAARALKTGRSEAAGERYIDILVTRMSEDGYDPFYSELLRLAETELRSQGCIVSNVWYREELSDERCPTEDVERTVNSLCSGRSHTPDGLIIIGRCSQKALKVLKRRERAIVSVSRNSVNNEVDQVLCDGAKIAMTAVSYLVRCGHSRIAYVGDCHGESRFAGFQSAQLRFRLEPELDYVFDTRPCEPGGYEAMEYFMKLEEPPTGIYCANDILAVGMLKCLSKRRDRYYLPSVISSDDIEEASYTSPMLTTVSLPKSEMIRFGVMLLLDRIAGGHRTVSRVELEGKLVIRESCRSINEAHAPEYFI